MKPDEAKAALDKLIVQGKAICEIAQTAERGKQSLRGHGTYADKFHEAVVVLSGILARLDPTFRDIRDDVVKAECDKLKTACGTLKSPDADAWTRKSALKNIELSCHTCIQPAMDRMDAPAVPASEQVLPMAVVRDTRGYFENMVFQANGCYEQGWFDASSVMIRKFIESLIIAVYEHANRANDIKNPRDDKFHMLSGLIEIILKDKAFNLARETQDTLPLVKQMGDRSAHTRRYMATRPDVDKIIPGLRVLAEELLHLAGLR